MSNFEDTLLLIFFYTNFWCILWCDSHHQSEQQRKCEYFHICLVMLSKRLDEKGSFFTRSLAIYIQILSQQVSIISVRLFSYKILYHFFWLHIFVHSNWGIFQKNKIPSYWQHLMTIQPNFYISIGQRVACHIFEMSICNSLFSSKSLSY